MNILHNLVQGSPEWQAHRANFRNASETPAVVGVSPWQSPYELWLIRTGRKPREETEAMRYGQAMEPAARSAYEQSTQLVVQPMVVVDGLYSASLDGITLDGSTLVEIKCPFKGNRHPLLEAGQRRLQAHPGAAGH